MKKSEVVGRLEGSSASCIATEVRGESRERSRA